jgi:molybdate transport system substrate-binding protein
LGSKSKMEDVMRRWFMCLGMIFLMCDSAFSEPVTVYAAASLTSVLQDLSKLAEQKQLPLRLSFGGSSTLAKQIVQGAPADVYFSANVAWMDYLAQEDMLEPDTRVNLLGNSLVVVATKDESFEVMPQSDFDFAKAFQGRLAVGDPSHVPAGIYAKEALIKLGWWDALKGRLAPVGDVRGALTLVARGECSAGIVYATDAAIGNGIEVIATLPDSLLQTPIVYPVAVVKGRRTPDVDAVMQFFQSEEAVGVFQKYGFRVLVLKKD